MGGTGHPRKEGFSGPTAHAALHGHGPCPSDCPRRAHLPTLPPLYQEDLLIHQDSLQAGPALEATGGSQFGGDTLPPLLGLNCAPSAFMLPGPNPQ